MTASSLLRIGDAEREKAAGWLAAHYTAGRLTHVEYEERLTAAFAARTGGDLDRLFADLPVLDEQRPPRPVLAGAPAGRRVPPLAFFALLLLVAMIARSAVTATAVAVHAGHDVGAGAGQAIASAAYAIGIVPLVVMAAVVLAASRWMLGRRRHMRRHQGS